MAEYGLRRVNNWLMDNKLTLSLPKTKFVPYFLSSTTMPNDHLRIHLHCYDCDSYTCNNCPEVTKCFSTKYLGVVLDSNMKWESQINLVCKRLRKLVYVFSNLRKFLTPRLMRVMYFALAQSVLLYGLPVWGGAYATTLNPVYICQKVLLRVITKSKFLEHTAPLFRNLKIFKLKYLIDINSVKQVLREKRFTYPSHEVVTRFQIQGNIALPLVHTTASLNVYVSAGIRVFNSLPSSVKNNLIDHPDKVNLILKKWFLQMQEIC